VSSTYRAPLIAALALALYLRFLLEPTAWLFYELYHATGVDAVYWGYSVFRFAGYHFGVWPYQTLASALAGLALYAWLAWRRSRAVTPAEDN